MSGAQPLIIPAGVGRRAILRLSGRIYNAILPFQQPADGRLVVFCWAVQPDVQRRFLIFRHDLDLLGNASRRQITRVSEECKAVRLTIARAALFNREQGQAWRTWLGREVAHRAAGEILCRSKTEPAR